MSVTSATAQSAETEELAVLAETNQAEHRAELVVERLAKRYGSRQVVKDVSLTVESGSVVGLLGPNGAGKTTCFYMVVGLVPLDSGSITLDGRSIAHMPIHRRARMGLSYLPQEASVFRRLTVEENIRAVLELQVDERGEELPSNVIVQVVSSEPGIKGDTASGATKPATLASGAVVNVPLFIKEGEWVKVDTRTGAYLERVNK